jgi:hypothetical protein
MVIENARHIYTEEYIELTKEFYLKCNSIKDPFEWLTRYNIGQFILHKFLSRYLIGFYHFASK